MTATIPPEQLSAFIDGELPPEAAAGIEAALRRDPALAAQADAFRRDRDALRAAYAPVASEPLPAAWLARIEAATAPLRDTAPAAPDAPNNVIAFRKRPAPPGPWQKALPKLRRAAPWAIAACLLLAFATPAIRNLIWQPAGDAILSQAESAQAGTLQALASLDGNALPPALAQRTLLRDATGLPVHAPDLRRLGWSLAALRTYTGAAELRYRNPSGQALTIYVRRSDGTARFDLLRHGKLRVCIWQDDVVGAVIMADMAAGPMMRVAVAAYNDLNS
jgi:anti-sigma factor RsiW